MSHPKSTFTLYTFLFIQLFRVILFTSICPFYSESYFGILSYNFPLIIFFSNALSNLYLYSQNIRNLCTLIFQFFRILLVLSKLRIPTSKSYLISYSSGLLPEYFLLIVCVLLYVVHKFSLLSSFAHSLEHVDLLLLLSLILWSIFFFPLIHFVCEKNVTEFYDQWQWFLDFKISGRLSSVHDCTHKWSLSLDRTLAMYPSIF